MSRQQDEVRILEYLGFYMGRKLTEPRNREKPSWLDDSVLTLFRGLEGEVGELYDTLENIGGVQLGVGALTTAEFITIADECADVANFAAMILDSAAHRVPNGPPVLPAAHEKVANEKAESDPFKEALSGCQSDTGKFIVHECRELALKLLAKNKAYGDSALDPMRIFSSANPIEQIKVRIDDKLSRLTRGHAMDDESMNDTIGDLLGYLVLLRIAINREA